MTFVSAPDGSPARRPDGSERGDVGADAQAAPDPEPGKAPRRSRRVLAINSSPLARKIISFNLLALLILVAGVLYLNPFRDSLVFQREQGLVFEAHLIADVFEAVATTEEAASDLGAMNVPRLVASLDLAPSLELFVFAPNGEVLARGEGAKPDRTPLVTKRLALANGWTSHGDAATRQYRYPQVSRVGPFCYVSGVAVPTKGLKEAVARLPEYWRRLRRVKTPAIAQSGITSNHFTPG